MSRWNFVASIGVVSAVSIQSNNQRLFRSAEAAILRNRLVGFVAFLLNGNLAVPRASSKRLPGSDFNHRVYTLSELVAYPADRQMLQIFHSLLYFCLYYASCLHLSWRVCLVSRSCSLFLCPKDCGPKTLERSETRICQPISRFY